jgi:hypothetical protein
MTFSANELRLLRNACRKMEQEHEEKYFNSMKGNAETNQMSGNLMSEYGILAKKVQKLLDETTP